MILLCMSGPKEVQLEYLDDDVGNVGSKVDTGWDPDNHEAESCQVAMCAECWWPKNKEKIVANSAVKSPFNGRRWAVISSLTGLGIGCFFCFQLVGKDGKGTKLVKFQCRPYRHGQLTQHVNQICHQEAVASYFGVPALRTWKQCLDKFDVDQHLEDWFVVLTGMQSQSP